MSSLFRRKPADVPPPVAKEEVPETGPRPKSYTPSKKELGVVTPKRSTTGRRMTEAAPANRREAVRQMRERQRLERAEAQAGMRAGDERYLLARDRGPERALVRDLVDSRRTAGTWFFGGALIVLVASSVRIPIVRVVGNVLWMVLAVAVVIDSVLIARRVKRAIRLGFPKTEQRLGSLQLYGIMRALTFRRMRVPKPRVELGDTV